MRFDENGCLRQNLSDVLLDNFLWSNNTPMITTAAVILYDDDRYIVVA
jgi:hypothetical protein